jgi:hypothetical protein
LNRLSTALSAAILLLRFVPPAHAGLFEDSRVEIVSARTAAIGGPHVAFADDLSTLFANPAGLRAAKPQMSVAELTLGLTGPIFSVADVASKVSDGEDPAALLATERVSDLFDDLYSSVTLNGPFAFGYVGDGLGLGFFNSSGVSVSTTGTVPTVTASVEEDFVLKGGYAFSIELPEETRSALDVGLMVEASIKNTIEVQETTVDFLTKFNSPSMRVLLSQPYFMDVGLGLDVGLLYSWNRLVAVGLVGRNLPTFTVRNAYSSFRDFASGGSRTVDYGYVPFDLTAGIMLTPELGDLNRYLTNLKLFLDYRDMLDFVIHPGTARNPLLHFGAGAEITVLEILSLRAGISEGYLSAGLGLDLSVCRIDFAIFGRELSDEPGERPVSTVLLGVSFIY